MSLFPELDGLTLDELIERWYAPSPDGEEDAAVYFEDAALLIRKQGELGVEFLFRAIDDADEDRMAAILLGLTVPPLNEPRVRTLLLSCLYDDRPMVVQAAIDGLAAQRDTKAKADVLDLRNHPSPYVRGGILRYMSHLFPDAAKPLLVESLNDPHFVVRENAIDELDEMDDPRMVEFLPLIRPFLADPHPDVRDAAHWFVKHWDWEEQDDESVVALRDDPSPYVRASVIRYMAELDPASARSLLVAALEDPDPIVRVNALDGLYDTGTVEEASAEVRRLLADPHPLVRQAAARAIEGFDWQAPAEVEESPVGTWAPVPQ